MPGRVAEMRVAPAQPDGAPKVIFAALDASIAADLEPRFADAGCAVVTNSSALRMKSDVPLVIPEVNSGHIKLIECQSWRKKSGGFVVTNPNCSAIGLVHGPGPLQQQFGIETVMAVTMQAVSGAGYPGVASLDILGNVIPYIAKEEEKMEEETLKLLGKLNGSGIIPAGFAMSAHCNRVAVEDGHTESVSIKLKKQPNSRRNHPGVERFPQRAARIAAAQRPRAAGSLPGNRRPAAAALRRGCRRRYDGHGGPLASLQRARLEVYRAFPQYDSRRRRSCPAECGTAQSPGISRLKL